MATDFKVSDIIDSKAIDEVNKLGSAFDATAEKYVNLTKALAGGIKIDPKSISELSQKQKSQNEILKELAETQNKLASIQEEYKKLLSQVSEQIKKKTSSVVDEANANKANAEAELASAKAKTEQIKQSKLIEQQNRKRKASEEEIANALRTEAQSIAQATEQNRILRQAVKEVVGTDEQAWQQRTKLNQKVNENTEFIRRNSDAYTKQKMTIGDYKEQMKIAWSEIRNGEKGFKNLGVVANGFGGILKTSVKSGLDQVTAGVGSMIKGFVGAQAIIGAFQKLIGQIKSGVNAIIDFEAANSKLAAILGTTSSSMKDLIADSRRLGAETKYTASQAAALQIELAKLGFSRKEILESTEYVLRFAQATGSELPEAAALAGASLRMFNADTTETERYVSAMAVATTKSALSFSYLQSALPTIGPVAKAFNFTIEDTLALLGKLADSGFDASSAATATRNILLNLADTSGKLATELGGPVRTLPELVSGLQKLKERGVDLNETLELTDKRSVAAFNAFLTASDKIVPLRDQITGVEGELKEMAETMNNNVQGAIYSLSSAWEAFFLSFMDSTGPMKDFINFLARGIRNIANDLKSLSEQQADRETVSKNLMQEQMREFDVVNININRVKELYNEKVKAGIDANKAEIEAKEEYLAEYERSLNAQRELYNESTSEQIKLQEQYGNASLFKQMFFLEKTNYQYEKAIKRQGTVSSELAAGIYKDETIIRAINSLQLASSENAVNKEQKLTDKQKKELEKRRKEYESKLKEQLKIRQAMQQSEFDLMDEGFEKELAKIRLQYNQKIAQIIGNSKEEQKTRENLATQMQRDIDKFEISFSIEKEKTNIQNKLAAIKDGSNEELELRLELLKYQQWAEEDASESTGADLLLIEQKYEKLREELRENFALKRIDKMQEAAVSEAIMRDAALSEELSTLSKQYAEGIIDKEKYETEKLRITREYAIKNAQTAVDALESQYEAEKALLSPEERVKMEEQITKAKIALSNLFTQKYVDDAKDREKADESWRKKAVEAIEFIADALNAFSELGSAIYDRKIQQVEEEQEVNQAAYDADIERIERLAETGAISSEEAEARKRAAEDRTAQKEAELAKQKAALQTRQAKLEKANNIMQIILSTAAAIMTAWKQLGAFGAPMAALIGALGAVQLATAIATPIPKYAKGTDNHPGGIAVVGDGGKKEAIITPAGKTFITPSIPTLVDLPSGSKVVPDYIDVLNLESLKTMRSDVGLMMKIAERNNEPVVIVNSDFSRLEREMRNMSELLAKSINENRRAAYYAEYRSRINNIKPI